MMSRVKLKICGVKSVDEARLLRDSGVDLVGLNFIAVSRRYISLDTARDIMAELAGSNVQTVALFADHPLAEVNTFADSLKVDYVQLHGDETADYAKDVQAKVIKAIAFKSGQTPEDLIEFINNFPADYFVLDRPRQGQGDVVNAEQAAEIIAARPNKIFLAGGLTADNLTEILVQTNPYGIDIAGGVRDAMDRLEISKVNDCLQIIRTLTGNA